MSGAPRRRFHGASSATARKGATKRRRMRVFRPVRLYRDEITVKEKFFLDDDQVVSNAGYQLVASLNAIDAQKLAAYQLLYRSFRIHGVKWTFLPRYSGYEYNQAVANAGAPVNFGGSITLLYSSKRDLSSAPTTYVRALTQSDVKIKVLPSGGWSVYEKAPVVVDDLDGTAARYLASPKLDTINSAATDHYTGTVWAESEGTGSPPFTIIGTIYFTLYDSREEQT